MSEKELFLQNEATKCIIECNSKKNVDIIRYCICYPIANFLSISTLNPLVIEKQILIFDSLQYHSLALSIRDHFSFANDAFRTPGYPAFLAIIYTIFGAHPFAGIFVNIFLNQVNNHFFYKMELH